MSSSHSPYQGSNNPSRNLKRNKTIPLVGLVTFLAGCTTTPEQSPVPEIELPDEWTATQTESRAPHAWLADFKSPALHAFISEAMEANANLERISAVLTQSMAEARISGADRLPSASAGLSGARQSINSFGPSATGGVIFEDFDLSLNLSWELDLWGRLHDLSSASTARIEANSADLQAARLSLAAQVTKVWFNIIEAKAQLTEAAHTAATYEKNQRTLENRFERGLASGLELRQTRSLAASAQADVARRGRALDAARRNLEVLLGRYPSSELMTDSETLPELPSAIPAGLPADLLQRRPDLIAAERRLAAADKDVEAKRKDLLPRISLTASTGTSSSEFEDLLDGDFSVWSLAANLTQPILQGGRIKGNIERSEAIRHQARAQYRDTALRAFLEVEQALAAEAYLQGEYASLKSATDESNAAESLAWSQYRDGTVDFLNVLDTQRSAANSRARLIASHNALLQNRIDLYLALGGPFEIEK